MVTSVREGVMSTHLHTNETSNHVNQLLINNGTPNEHSYEGVEEVEAVEEMHVIDEARSTSAHSGVGITNQLAQRMSLQRRVHPSDYMHHVKEDNHTLTNENDTFMNNFMNIYLNEKKNTQDCNATQFTSNQYTHTNHLFNEEHSYVPTNQYDYLNEADTNMGHFSEATTMEGRDNHASGMSIGTEHASPEVLYMHMMRSGERNEPFIGDHCQGDYSPRENSLLRCNGINGGVSPCVLKNGGAEDAYKVPSIGDHSRGDKPDHGMIDSILKRALLSSDILQNEILSSEMLSSEMLSSDVLTEVGMVPSVAPPQQEGTDHHAYARHGNFTPGREDAGMEFHLNSQAILAPDHLASQNAQINYNEMNGGACQQLYSDSYSDSYRPRLEGNLFYNTQFHAHGISNEKENKNNNKIKNKNNHPNRVLNRSCTDGLHVYYEQHSRGGDGGSTGEKSLYVSSGRVSNASVGSGAHGQNIQNTDWDDEGMNYMSSCRWSERRTGGNSSAAHSDGVKVIGEGSPCDVNRQCTHSIRNNVNVMSRVRHPSLNIACPNVEEEGPLDLSFQMTSPYTKSNEEGGPTEEEKLYSDYSTRKCEEMHYICKEDASPNYICKEDTSPHYICECTKGLPNSCERYSGGDLYSLETQMDVLHGGEVLYKSDSPHLGLEPSIEHSIQCIDARVKTEPMVGEDSQVVIRDADVDQALLDDVKFEQRVHSRSLPHGVITADPSNGEMYSRITMCVNIAKGEHAGGKQPMANTPFNGSDPYPSLYTQGSMMSSVPSAQTNGRRMNPVGPATPSQQCSRFNEADTHIINSDYHFMNAEAEAEEEEEQGPLATEHFYPYNYQRDVMSVVRKEGLEDHLPHQEDLFNRHNVSHFSLNSVLMDSLEDEYNARNRVSSVCSNSCEASVGTLHDVSPLGSPLATGATTDLQNQNPFSRNNTCNVYGRDLGVVEGMQSNHCSMILPRLIHNDMPADANHDLGLPPLIRMGENNSFNRYNDFSEASPTCVNLPRGVSHSGLANGVSSSSISHSGPANGASPNEHAFVGSNCCTTINGINDPCSMQVVDASNRLCLPNGTTNQIGIYNYELLTFKQPSNYYDGVNDVVVKGGRPDDVTYYTCATQSVGGENNYVHVRGDDFGSTHYSTNNNFVRTKEGFPHVSTGEYVQDSRSSTTTSVINEDMVVGSGFSRGNMNMQDGSPVNTLRDSVIKLMSMMLQRKKGVGGTNGVTSTTCTNDMVCNTGYANVNPSLTNYDRFPSLNHNTTQGSNEQRKYMTSQQMKSVQRGSSHRRVYPGVEAPSRKTPLQNSKHVKSAIRIRRWAIPRVSSPRMHEPPTAKLRIVKMSVVTRHMRTPRIHIPFITTQSVSGSGKSLAHLFHLRMGTPRVTTTRMSVIRSINNSSSTHLSRRDEQMVMMKSVLGENEEGHVTNYNEAATTGANVHYEENRTFETSHNDETPVEKKATKKRSRKSRVKRKNKVFGGIVKKGGISFDLEVESRRIKETPFCAYSLIDLLNNHNAGRRDGGVKTTVNGGGCRDMLWCSCDIHHNVNCFTEYVHFLRGKTMGQGEKQDREEEQEQMDENDETSDSRGHDAREECPSESSRNKTEGGKTENTKQLGKERECDAKKKNFLPQCENVYYNVNKIWSSHFNRPLGDIGRKLILKEIRELHYKDAFKTTSLLTREGLDYGKVRFMKVSELYHYMYALGVFEYAVKISLEFGSNIRMSSVVTQGNYRNTCNNLNNGYNFCFICCSCKNPSLSYIPLGFHLAQHRMYIKSYSTFVEEFASRYIVNGADRQSTRRTPMRKFLPPNAVSAVGAVSGVSGVVSRVNSIASSQSSSPTNALSFRTSGAFSCEPSPSWPDGWQLPNGYPDGETKEAKEVGETSKANEAAPFPRCDSGARRHPRVRPGATSVENRMVPVTGDFAREDVHPKGAGECQEDTHTNNSISDAEEEREVQENYCIGENLKKGDEDDNGSSGIAAGSTTTGDVNGIASCSVNKHSSGCTSGYASGGGSTCHACSSHSYTSVGKHQPYVPNNCSVYMPELLSHPPREKSTPYGYYKERHDATSEVAVSSTMKGEACANWKELILTLIKNEDSNCNERDAEKDGKLVKGINNPYEVNEVKNACPYIHEEIASNGGGHLYVGQAKILSPPGAATGSPHDSVKGDEENIVQGENVKEVEREVVKEEEGKTARLEGGPSQCDDFVTGDPPQCDDCLQEDPEESQLHTESEGERQSKGKNKIIYRGVEGDLVQAECMHRYGFPSACNSGGGSDSGSRRTRAEATNIIKRIKRNKVYTSIIHNLLKELLLFHGRKLIDLDESQRVGSEMVCRSVHGIDPHA
ncbi:hypothetical protein AK88_01614 [Plasmodium fragile]|uniref:Uncharacterized protein n=1 Tax=Plasmodium fragile TaxID=5857 RepID=A0A0D9QP89_PLAFR|nr:uncharacterized protein AK88_01614 [Plasmodium fragile]KJP88733.1 hypothetical protein AK88_01614 [Plasmodium fragile]